MLGRTCLPQHMVSLSGPKKVDLVTIVSQPVGMGEMDKEITYLFLLVERPRVFSSYPIGQNLVTGPELAASESEKYDL